MRNAFLGSSCIPTYMFSKLFAILRTFEYLLVGRVLFPMEESPGGHILFIAA